MDPLLCGYQNKGVIGTDFNTVIQLGKNQSFQQLVHGFSAAEQVHAQIAFLLLVFHMVHIAS